MKKILVAVVAIALALSSNAALAIEFVKISGTVSVPPGFVLVGSGVVVEDGQYTASSDEGGNYEVVIPKGSSRKFTITSRVRDASAPSDDSIDVFSNWSAQIDASSSKTLDFAIPAPNRLQLRFVDASDRTLNLVRFADAAFNQKHSGSRQSGYSWEGIQRLVVNKDRPGWGPWTQTGFAEVLVFDTSNFEGFGYKGFEFGYELEGLGFSTPYTTSSHFPVNSDMELKLCSPVRFGPSLTLPADCLKTRQQQIEEEESASLTPEEPADSPAPEEPANSPTPEEPDAPQIEIALKESTPFIVRPGDLVGFDFSIQSSLRPTKTEVHLLSPNNDLEEVKRIQDYPESWVNGANEGGFFRIPLKGEPGYWRIELVVTWPNNGVSKAGTSKRVSPSLDEAFFVQSLTLDGSTNLTATRGEVHDFRTTVKGDPDPAIAYFWLVGHPDLDFEMRMSMTNSTTGLATFDTTVPILEEMSKSSYEVRIRAVNRSGESTTKSYTLSVSEDADEVVSDTVSFSVQKAGSQLVLKAEGPGRGTFDIFEDGVFVERFSLTDRKRAHVVESRITGTIDIRTTSSSSLPVKMTREHLWFDNVNLGRVNSEFLSNTQESTLDFTANGYDKNSVGSWTSRATSVTKFICTGIYGPGASFDDKVSARKRAKMSCEYAERMNPNLDISYWFQTKQTSVASFVDKVLVTVKGFEPELLVALEDDFSESEPAIPSEAEQDGDVEPESNNAGYESLNVPVATSTGMTVTVTKLSLEDRPGSTRLNLTYEMENNTRSSGIVEGSFKLFFSDGTYQNQFGLFDKLFPTDSSRRSYSFEWEGPKRPTFIEYEADFFASEPGDGKKWRVN